MLETLVFLTLSNLSNGHGFFSGPFEGIKILNMTNATQTVQLTNGTILKLDLSQILPPPSTPPTTPGPPPNPEQIANHGKMPDNLNQQCVALHNGQPPPGDVFSASSKPIPPGYGTPQHSLCSIFPQFSQAQELKEALNARYILTQIHAQMIKEHDNSTANFFNHLKQLNAQGIINCPNPEGTIQTGPTIHPTTSPFGGCSLSPPIR